jgi:hypothetical protein
MNDTKDKSTRGNTTTTTNKRIARTYSMDAHVVRAIEKFAMDDNRTPSNALETILLRQFPKKN